MASQVKEPSTAPTSKQEEVRKHAPTLRARSNHSISKREKEKERKRKKQQQPHLHGKGQQQCHKAKAQKTHILVRSRSQSLVSLLHHHAAIQQVPQHAVSPGVATSPKLRGMALHHVLQELADDVALALAPGPAAEHGAVEPLGERAADPLGAPGACGHLPGIGNLVHPLRVHGEAVLAKENLAAQAGGQEPVRGRVGLLVGAGPRGADPGLDQDVALDVPQGLVNVGEPLPAHEAREASPGAHPRLVTHSELFSKLVRERRAVVAKIWLTLVKPWGPILGWRLADRAGLLKWGSRPMHVLVSHRKREGKCIHAFLG